MAPKSKAEKKYLAEIPQFKDSIFMAHPESPMEGFEYFETDEYKIKSGYAGTPVKQMMFSNGPGHFIKMLGIMKNYMKPMMKGRRECFTDLEEYFQELQENKKISRNRQLFDSYPNNDLWKEVQEYSEDVWNAKIGFTELDDRLIFKDKGVLFKYVLVVVQEMKKDKIDKAPGLEAGAEVQRVYNSLGHAVNDIARWLRNEYGIKCQSNHPLGGLVNTPPLAGKAGLGWQGLDGLLITPEYGKRVRIAPIFIQERIFEFTDSIEHSWIEDFCQSRQKCRRSCPTGAILEEKVTTFTGLDVIGQTKTCIDREKCFPQFCKTLGCSICIRVCPFSKGQEAYEKIKRQQESAAVKEKSDLETK